MSARTWSPQQLDIFDWFKTGVGHKVVRARAGTGKTTTIIEGITHAPETNILLAAFNKRIAEELQARLTKGEAKTLHSVGYSCVRRFWEGLKIAQGSDRADDLANRVCGPTAPDAMKRLVSKLHSKGREIAPHARKLGDLTDIAYTFDCVPDEQWEDAGWDVARIESLALAAMDLAAREKPVTTGIDFADMIFLPVRNKWLVKKYDLVVVDEAQDMTVAQLEIALGVCKGRMCVVGDDRQAIYGFRGADSDSIDRLKAHLNATELGLTTTYRCGTEIVKLASELVPDFSAGANVPAGEVLALGADKLVDAIQAGAFLLSRTNAPLVACAMSFLRAGKRTRVAGRDIGTGLKNLIRKLKARSVPQLMEKISAWQKRETARFAKANKQQKIDAIADQAETLIALAEGAKSVAELEGRIDSLFTDDGLGQAGLITCSTVHRAKGLEADSVFILVDTLRTGGKEEDNIKYVAITRAKQHLTFVAGIK